jgi:hypothetical protein
MPGMSTQLPRWVVSEEVVEGVAPGLLESSATRTELGLRSSGRRAGVETPRAGEKVNRAGLLQPLAPRFDGE